MGTSQIPLWGRAYELTVTLNSGDYAVLSSSSWEPEALRITFEVLQSSIQSPYWFADISVYNLTARKMLELVNAGPNSLWLTLKAGYQTGNNVYSIIWSGPVLQVMFDQENVVDKVLRFNCVQGANQTFQQMFTNLQVGPFTTQYQAIAKMIQQSSGEPDAQVGALAKQRLSAKQYPRGKTFFGTISKYMAEMAQDNGLTTWIKENRHYLTELYNPEITLEPDLSYGPPLPPGGTLPQNNDPSVNRSIIGIPRRFPQGCIFTTLLDPRLEVKLPLLLVHIEGIVQQYKLQIGQLPTIYDTSGNYVVGQVRHYGDSRGNPWYTEVTGYQRAYAQTLMEI